MIEAAVPFSTDISLFVSNRIPYPEWFVIAHNATIENSFVETVRDSLNIKFEEQQAHKPLGIHLWDVLEYDTIRIIKIYEPDRLIVVLAKSHTSPGDIAETVLGYQY